ncbi:MAG: ubiquinol-cytochrome C chaperone family protein [Alphaproteobacteria bacterium]
MSLLQRLHHFLSKPLTTAATASLYKACVTQARRVEFYETCGVPDTLDGRFDLLLLHVFMVMRRLGDEKDAKQALFDLMFADMDRSLREMGVGDMSVGKKIRPMISAFYGRGQAYEKAFQASDEELKQTLQRNLYALAPVAPDILTTMSSYTRRAVTELDQQEIGAVLEGQVHFPARIG